MQGNYDTIYSTFDFIAAKHAQRLYKSQSGAWLPQGIAMHAAKQHLAGRVKRLNCYENLPVF